MVDPTLLAIVGLTQARPNEQDLVASQQAVRYFNITCYAQCDILQLCISQRGSVKVSLFGDNYHTA